MSFEVQVHGAQANILRELLFVQAAGYAQLQRPTGLTSDHFNFHIRRLVDLGLVDKVAKGTYSLSVSGKEFANKMDTDQKSIERQPKVAVMLAAERMHDGQKEYLFQERLKNPYFGYWGWPTGKIRWGESVEEAAVRELKEETGLTAEVQILGVYHEHAYLEETGALLEDKIFFAVRCSNPQGELLDHFEGGHNAWLTEQAVSQLAKKYSSFVAEMKMAKGESAPFVHEIHQYRKEQF
jgi:8-oxo-dGTP diphosphatase